MGVRSGLAPFVCAACLLLVGCSAGDGGSGSSESTAAAPEVWYPLGTWAGRGDRQTESFDATTGALRLAWEAANNDLPGAGTLRIQLRSAISGRSLRTVLDTAGAGSGEVRVGIDPHVAYLQIDSEGADWRITLEERIQSRPEGVSPDP